jgi:hypothetical protein
MSRSRAGSSPMNAFPRVACALLLALAPAPAFCALSPSILRVITGSTYMDCFGEAVAPVGDLDGDGRGDFIVGAPKACAVGAAQGPGAYADVYSGRTGARLYRLISPAGGADAFGAAVAGGRDLDGDGVPDIVVGAPSASRDGQPLCGSIYVFSGATAQELYDVDGAPYDRLGSAVAMIADINGDGRAEVVAGSPGLEDTTGTGVGGISVFSGATGRLLYRVLGSSHSEDFGTSMSDLGDVNGNGIDDFVVGAVAGCSGAAYILEGADGTEIRRLNSGGQSCDDFGFSVAGVPDLDGDGVPDVWVGGPGGTLGDRGSIDAFSGASGALLRALAGDDGVRRLGTTLAWAGDVDGDSHPEVIAGAPTSYGMSTGPFLPEDAGYFSVYSYALDSTVVAMIGPSSGVRLGEAVSRVDDVNGDGRGDILVGLPVGRPDAVTHLPGPGLVWVAGLAEMAEARAFLGGGSTVIHMGASNPISLRVEFTGAGFVPADVVAETVRLRAAGDDLDEVQPTSVNVAAGDTDGDGIAELGLIIGMDAFRNLVTRTRGQTDTLGVVVVGDLRDGHRLEGAGLLRLEPVAPRSVLLTPNPVRTSATLSFRTTRAGAIRIRVFDLQGRQVESLLEGAYPAGYHDVRLEPSGWHRTPGSGVYFCRVESPDGTTAARFVLLR